MSESADSEIKILQSKLEQSEALVAKLQQACANIHDEALFEQGKAVDEAIRRQAEELYDIVYKGEDPSLREVRWKWIVLGVQNMREDLDNARAKLAEKGLA